MRLQVVIVLVVVSSLAALGPVWFLGRAQDGHEGGADRNVLHFSYDAGPDTFAQLVETAEAVVVASPVGQEVVLAVFDDGIQITGQSFVTLSTIKGPVPAGSNITVLRTTLSNDASVGELHVAEWRSYSETILSFWAGETPVLGTLAYAVKKKELGDFAVWLLDAAASFDIDPERSTDGRSRAASARSS
jgi:hypothetical protein